MPKRRRTKRRRNNRRGGMAARVAPARAVAPPVVRNAGVAAMAARARAMVRLGENWHADGPDGIQYNVDGIATKCMKEPFSVVCNKFCEQADNKEWCRHLRAGFRGRGGRRRTRKSKRRKKTKRRKTKRRKTKRRK